MQAQKMEDNPTSKFMSNLLADLGDLYKSPKWTDVIIQVGGEIILAHKLILCARNASFAAMFPPDTINTDDEAKIIIQDIKADTFKIFLKYLYTGIINEDDVTKDLLNVAYTYSDQHLKNFCDARLSKILQEENVIEMLLFATKSDCKEIIKNAAELIVKKYETLSELEAFQLILENKKAVSAVLEAFNKNDKRFKDSCFDGIFYLKIYGNGKQQSRTKTFYVQNIPWQISVCQSIHDNKAYLGVYLYCESKVLSFACKTKFTLKLISLLREEDNKVFKTTHTFTNIKKNWGFNHFLLWSDLMNEENGYIDNNTVAVEIAMKPGPFQHITDNLSKRMVKSS